MTHCLSKTLTSTGLWESELEARPPPAREGVGTVLKGSKVDQRLFTGAGSRGPLAPRRVDSDFDVWPGTVGGAGRHRCGVVSR
jgi:hypothetical protein